MRTLQKVPCLFLMQCLLCLYVKLLYSINNNAGSVYFLGFGLCAHTLINTFSMLFWYLRYSLLGTFSSYVISVILNFSINATNEPYLTPQTKQDHQRAFTQSLSKLLLLELFLCFNRQVRQP